MPPRPPITVRPAAAADRAAVSGVLAHAFVADPALAYVFPDASRRADRLAHFFDLITATEADPALTDLALGPDGAPVAAAIWRAPGTWKTPASTMFAHAWPMLRTFGTALPRALALQAALEAHHPATPHWYLEFAGCVPTLHGRGYGGAAIRARLAHCDAGGHAAALETAKESNLALYRSLGFEVTDSFTVPRGPMFWSMWREPR